MDSPNHTHWLNNLLVKIWPIVNSHVHLIEESGYYKQNMIVYNISIVTWILLISSSKVLMNTETPDNNDSDDEKFIDGIDHLKSGINH